GGGFGSLLTGSTLDGVTLNADLDVPGGGGRNAFVVIRNGLTLNGTITLRDAFLGNPAIAFLLFDSSETLSGTGTVHFPNNSPNNGVWLPNANTTLTIAPGFTVDGVAGFIGSGLGGSADVAVFNQGTINATGGGAITVSGAVTNEGTIESTGGGTVAVSGTG